MAGAISVMLICGSCKEKPQHKPQRFDRQIDGIAVYPSVEIDIELAQRINRQGPILPTTEITPNYQEPAAGYTPEPAPGTDASATEFKPEPGYEPYYEKTEDANGF